MEEAPGQVHVRPSLTPVKQPPVLLFHTRAAQQGESQDVRVRAERKAGRCAALQQKRRLTTISLTKKGRIEVYRTSSEQSNPLSARHEHRSRLEGASGVQPSPDTGAAQKCTSFLSHGLTRHQRPGRPCCVGYSAGSSSPAQRPAALPSPRLQPPPRQLVAAASAALPSLLALVRPAPSCRRAEADNSVVGRAGCGGVAWSGGGSGGGKSAVGGEDGGSGGAHGVHHRAGAQGGGDDQLHERHE